MALVAETPAAGLHACLHPGMLSVAFGVCSMGIWPFSDDCGISGVALGPASPRAAMPCHVPATGACERDRAYGTRAHVRACMMMLQGLTLAECCSSTATLSKQVRYASRHAHTTPQRLHACMDNS